MDRYRKFRRADNRVVRLCFAVFFAAFAGPVFADDGIRDLCPDRPGKNTSACTLDAGYFQIESDLFNGSFQHTGGITTDIYYVTNPNIKYGVSDAFDVELNLAPDVIVRTHDSATDTTQTEEGLGDLFLRAKYAAIGNGGSDFAFVLEPYLKLPTARIGMGDGAVEGGIVAPLSLDLGDGWSLGSTPEVDVLKNNLDDGRHATLTNVISIGRAVGSGVTLGTELWESTNFDPARTTEAYSFDIDAAWQPSTNLQLDAGINLGLNRSTPGSQAYFGISRRL
jgi:Putative MetA-pathway of phenol degradation